MRNKPSAIGLFLSQISLSVVFLISIGITGYYYSNGYDDGTQLEKQIAETIQLENIENAKKKETEKLLAEETAMKQEVGELGDKFREISSKLPLSLKTQEIIDTINQLAKNAGCRIVSIKPETIVSRDLYDEIPIKIEMRGQFSNLVVFMYYLSSLERVTRTGDVDFTNEGSKYTGMLSYNTSVVSFRYRPPVDKNQDNEKNKKNDKTRALLDDELIETIKEKT